MSFIAPFGQEAFWNELQECLDSAAIAAPCFIYDLNALARHARRTKEELTGAAKIFYAQKANPLGAILSTLRAQGLAIDLAGEGELSQALRCGFNRDMIATGPAKSKAYLRTLCESGVEWIVCESTNQLLWLNEVARERGEKAKALLRVQFRDEETNRILGGGDASAFGQPASVWMDSRLQNLDAVEIVGLHFFQWGNMIDASFLEKKWRKGLELLHELRSYFSLNNPIVDLGGGLGMNYHCPEERIDLKQTATILRTLKKDFQLKEVWLELGRYLTADCGIYLNQIVDKKRMEDQEILILAGGINHLARPALTGEYFPVSELSAKASPTKEIRRRNFRLHGPLCTALDYHGTASLDESVAPGDWLVFKQCGAYGFTESMPLFLCHDGASEWVYSDKLRLERSALKSSDWMK